MHRTLEDLCDPGETLQREVLTRLDALPIAQGNSESFRGLCLRQLAALAQLGDALSHHSHEFV